MYAIVRKDSKVEGTGDNRTVSVNRVRVTSLEQAKQAGVIIAEKKIEAGIRVVTLDGQKLDFNRDGKLVAGGIEHKEDKGSGSYGELQRNAERKQREDAEAKAKAEAEAKAKAEAEEEARKKAGQGQS